MVRQIANKHASVHIYYIHIYYVCIVNKPLYTDIVIIMEVIMILTGCGGGDKVGTPNPFLNVKTDGLCIRSNFYDF